MTKRSISRRGALKLGAAATALPLVHIRTGRAAGKVAIGFWDHWVPGGNDVMQKQVDDWAKKNQVEAHVDFITSTGNKLQLTGVAEAQAKAGHDALAFFNWDVYNVADALEPMDDVMQRLVAKNGAVDPTCEYLAKAKGQWVAVPTSSGTQTKPPCARISWFKQHGLDLQAMYPAKEDHNALQDAWTWDEFAKYAEAATKDGNTFALGMGGGGNTDATDMHGALFKSFGATLIDEKGNIQLKSDAMKQAAGIRAEAGEVLSGGRGQLRRRIEQPRVDLRQERADLQSAVGLGGGEARCAAGGGGLLDVPGAVRPEGSLRSDAELLLGGLQVQPEQAGGKGADRVSDATGTGGAALRRHLGL